MPRHTPALAPVRVDLRWVTWACAALVLLSAGKAPTLDEESYLWLGAHVDLARPYDWERAWPPWTEGNGFVYAHPPLHLAWMRLWSWLHASVPLMRLAAGLPWAMLLGAAVARLAVRTTHHPHLAALAWITSTTVVLGLQDSLMIDLPATALATAALAAWREAIEHAASGTERDGMRWAAVAGLALGAALVTKYSVVVFVPVLALHAARARWQGGLVLLGLAAGVVVIVEGWIALTYGRVHVWEVWTRRAEIGAGAVGPRALGTLARTAMLSLPLVLVLARPAIAAVGVALGLAALVVGCPEGLSFGAAGLLLGCAALGGMIVARAGEAAFRGAARRRKGDRDDALLLGGWVLAGVVGVVLLHNYASARYLFPVAAPVALLLGRAAEEVQAGKRVLVATSVLSGVLALALAIADARLAAAGEDVARAALAEVARCAGESTEGCAPAASSGAPVGGALWGPGRAGGVAGGGSPLPQEAPTHGAAAELPPAGALAPPPDLRPDTGVFAGEWSFRGVFEAAGWRRYVPGTSLPPCTWLVAAENASPGELPRLEALLHVEGEDRFPLRVVDLRHHIGLYAETLGPLPFGLASGPLESATLYRSPGCPTKE